MKFLNLVEFFHHTRCKCPSTLQWIKRCRVAAFDVGSSNVGLAVSDDYQESAIPLYSMHRLHPNGPLTEESKQKLAHSIMQHQIAGFLVGIPTAETQFSMQEEFIYILSAYHKLPIDFVLWWDESYSSEIATHLFNPTAWYKRERNFGKLDRKKIPKIQKRDEEAASVILSEYLGTINRKFFTVK
jgi:RNase H-fold protein (predicted Holliday junction resolvase)